MPACTPLLRCYNPLAMKQNRHVYLDYAATTPVDARVAEAMQPFFGEHFGNPSSVHLFGQRAEAAVENARERVAEVLQCQPQEIVFTACGTESDNLALRGAAFAARQTRGANHLLVSPVEHHAVSHTAQQLADLHGFELEMLPVDSYGQVHPDQVEARLREDTALVSVIYANNEIGTINPIARIGRICQERGIPFHSDAVQAGAYLALNVQSLNVDLMALGAHKFYGPKGVGVLYIRSGTAYTPTMTGGGQEEGRRAGTQNVPFIVGLAEALMIAKAERAKLLSQVIPLRDQLISQVLETIPDSQLSGHPSQRLPNHASFVLQGVDGNALLAALDVEGFACSSGSACKTGSPEPSEVLTALGYDDDWALGSLRVTLGRGTTKADIQRFLVTLPGLVERMRGMS